MSPSLVPLSCAVGGVSSSFRLLGLLLGIVVWKCTVGGEVT